MALALFDMLFPDAASPGEAPGMYARKSLNAKIGYEENAGLRLTGQGHIELFSISAVEEKRLLLEQPFSGVKTGDLPWR
ncbi:MAG: hypothetical protein FWG17_01455 [Desulfovibrionaceae bacterium]|nr:hypothetical protein [Desulfovibrionaceae bacterium]